MCVCVCVCVCVSECVNGKICAHILAIVPRGKDKMKQTERKYKCTATSRATVSITILWCIDGAGVCVYVHACMCACVYECV